MTTLTTVPNTEITPKEISISVTQDKFQEIKKLLVDYPLELVESGKMDILEALAFQTRIFADIKIAKKELTNGDFYSIDEVFAKYKI